MNLEKLGYIVGIGALSSLIILDLMSFKVYKNEQKIQKLDIKIRKQLLANAKLLSKKSK